ncbi:MAG: hypothetical protein RBG1_1C00001G1202 [candidate division Zixibacteria bacterium RBG-1]|nr:MAG: hypothetical protein RBG1_1C00001G1202 [candidate division Zixibacteria bacterium RBG-1]
MNWKVYLSDIDLTQKEIQAVTKVLKSRWLTMGEVTQNFEKAFAKFLGVKHALAVASGTAALHLALKALELKPGDEVLLPSLTFVASANAIVYNQAKPVFVDISSLDNLNISVEDLQRKITDKTRTILVVHYAGYPADMVRINQIAQKYNLAVIEDSAHAIGAEINKKKMGTWGDMGCFSFFSNKNLVTGEGGMLVTNSDELAQKLKLLRSHGMTTLTWERHKGQAHCYDVVELGFNYRMTEIESALGIEQLKKLKKNNTKRERLTKFYIKQLKGVSQIKIPFLNYPHQSSFHIFPILLGKGIDRNRFLEEMKKRKIQTSVHYQPVHKFTYYQNNFPEVREISLPNTEYVGKQEVTLPLHPLMTERDVIYVCNSIRKIIK